MPTPLSVRNTNLTRNQFHTQPNISRKTWLLVCIPLVMWLIVSLVTTPAALFLEMNQRARVVPDIIWIFFDLLGNGWYDFALATPLLLLAPRNLVASLIAGASAGALGRVLKLTFEMPRPASVLDQASFHIIGQPLTSLAMPSGHTLTAFSIITALYFTTSPDKRKPFIFLFLFAIAAGLARIAVGAHWPADVMAGAALGIFGGLTGAQLALRIPGHTLRPQSWLMRFLAVGSCVCVYVLMTTEIDFKLSMPFQWMAAAIASLGLIFFITQTLRRSKY